MKKVYQVKRNRGEEKFLWFTRGENEKYIVDHQNKLSNHIISQHYCYHVMQFDEVTNPDKEEWVNYVIDTNKYISFELFLSNKRKNFKSLYKKDDIVVTKKLKFIVKLIDIIEVNNFNINLLNPMWKFVKGFQLKLDKIGSSIPIYRNGTVYDNEIERLATDDEKNYFNKCISKGKILNPAIYESDDYVSNNTEFNIFIKNSIDKLQEEIKEKNIQIEQYQILLDHLNSKKLIEN